MIPNRFDRTLVAQCAGSASRRLTLVVAAAALLGATGCFSERSFPIRAHDYHAIREHVAPRSTPPNTRAWLRRAHGELAALLPPGDPPALLTDDLVGSDGQPRDVYAYFGRDPAGLASVFGNLDGLEDTAQAAGQSSDRPTAPWAGFDVVWVPAAEGVALAGQFGRPLPGTDATNDCIVLISGIFGDNNIRRTHDLAMALRGAGHHVLALELRGAGRTGARYPNVPYNFGAVETGDLLAVSEWLERQPGIERTGLIGYCWGANLALLAAWEDARPVDDPDVAPPLRPHLRPRTARRHFTAGIMACSPTIGFEPVVDKLDARKWTVWNDPVLGALQREVDRQGLRHGHGAMHGSLRRLIVAECARARFAYREYVRDGLRYLRLLPGPGRPVGRKLANARIPVLIVHAVNDPLGPASDVAAFIAQIDNPAVAAVILPGGGHVGFIPYARAYSYSLMLNFFDPQRGPAAGAYPPKVVDQ